MRSETVLTIVGIGSTFLAAALIAGKRNALATTLFAVAAGCMFGLAVIVRPFLLAGLTFGVVAVLLLWGGLLINWPLYRRVHNLFAGTSARDGLKERFGGGRPVDTSVSRKDARRP